MFDEEAALAAARPILQRILYQQLLVYEIAQRQLILEAHFRALYRIRAVIVEIRRLSGEK